MNLARRVTIRDVAARAEVSIATVSKVMNGRYGVASDTIERVERAIADLGYEASLAAQSLRNRRTNVIGVLVADFEPFSTEVLKGAADAIRGTGFELVVYSSGGRVGEHVGWERRYLSRLSGTLVDGAVIVTPTVTDINYGAPIVAVDPHTGPSEMPTVDSDNSYGARLAVRHLLDLGHRRIAMISGRPDLQSAQMREAGYRTTLAAANIPVDESLIQLGAFEPDIARQAAYSLFTTADRPTAVFAGNDLSAITAMEVATDLGLRVPNDLSVVGFDNIPESALATPPLTTVEQPIRQMGQRAMELLVRLIREEPVETNHIRLTTRLVERHSTAAPRFATRTDTAAGSKAAVHAAPAVAVPDGPREPVAER